MEEEKKVDECLEPLKKIVDLDFKLDRLIMERTKKEEEFKEYIREQDKIINTINEKKRIIGKAGCLVLFGQHKSSLAISACRRTVYPR